MPKIREDFRPSPESAQSQLADDERMGGDFILFQPSDEIRTGFLEVGDPNRGVGEYHLGG
jgi:hypothetical protein